MFLTRSEAKGSHRPQLRWLSWLARRDRWALFILIVIPILIYVPYTFTGHIVVPGDNLTQNLPLRVLSGSLIREGRLPAWNPLIWSGTPLLAGWNAGALYPGTFLFAIFPAVAAWTMNLIAVPMLAAIGMFLFLRQIKCHTLGAFWGAVVFSYTGFLSGQVVHIGLTQGTSLLPWILLGIQGIFTPTQRRWLPGFTVLLAVAFGCVVLAGDPRAATSAVIVVMVYGLACTWRLGRASLISIYATVIAIVLGTFFSAVQWLPGLEFLQHSQRGTTPYSFFGAGSLGFSHVATLLLVPFYLGGNGNFGLPIYAGSYNLPEVTIGVGIVALCAAAAFVPELVVGMGQFLRRLQRKSYSAAKRPLLVWYVFLVIGLALTLGATTPLGHLLVHIPLYGKERLQNRNAIFIDLGLTVLCGYFVDYLGLGTFASQLRARKSNAASSILESAPRWRLVATIPALVLLGLIAYIAHSPSSLLQHLQINTNNTTVVTQLAPYFAATAVVGFLAILLVLVAPRLSRTTRITMISVLMVADVGLFVANASYAEAPTSEIAASSPQSTQVAELDGPDGRFAIYDPHFFAAGSTPSVSALAGVADINIFQGNPSVQGYGSIVQGTYQNATQTHNYEDLAIGRLQSETFNTLDLKTLLTLPAYIATNLSPHDPVPTPGTNYLGRTISGPWKFSANTQHDFVLPGEFALQRATITLHSPTTLATALRVGFIANDGTTTFANTTQEGTNLFASAPSGKQIVAVTITAPDTHEVIPDVDAVVAVTAVHPQRIALDGPLQGPLSPFHWQYKTTLSPYLVYSNDETLGLAWLQKARARTPNTAQAVPGSVRVLTKASASTQTMIVSAPTTVTLARSETYSPGWTARITPINGGKTVVETVRRFGLVQAVSVTPGTYRVTWRYAPSQVFIGFLLSVMASLALVLLLVVVVARRRRHNRLLAPDVPLPSA